MITYREVCTNWNMMWFMPFSWFYIYYQSHKMFYLHFLLILIRLSTNAHCLTKAVKICFSSTLSRLEHACMAVYYILSYKHCTLYYHWLISWYSFRINDSSCLLCGFSLLCLHTLFFFFARSHLKTRGLPRVYKLVYIYI